VFRVTDKLYMGLTGLASDVTSLKDNLNFKTNLYKLSENREIKPEAFSALLSTMLYEKRFGPWFCEPVVAGLREDNSVFMSGMDLIGAPVFSGEISSKLAISVYPHVSNDNHTFSTHTHTHSHTPYS
jgi:20S proteasome subunit beta 3